MSSFFTVPGAHKKRKQTGAPEPPKKRFNASKASSKPSGRAPAKSAPSTSKRPERDESISGSDSEEYGSDAGIPEHEGSDNGSDDTDNEGETAAERRLRLAERYLANVRQEVVVDEHGFDAEEIDRDMIAERLIEDAAETKGKVYRHLAKSLEFEKASHTMFRWNTENVTSVALCSPYAYTTSKDGYLVKWKLQDLPKDQYPQTTNKKPKKPPAPPRRRPERIAMIRSEPSKAKDRTFQGHTGGILVVAASQDGKFVVTGGSDKRLVVHDAETLKPLRAFTHHRDAVTGLAFRRGTNQLYSCSRDRTVKVWSLDELAYVETLFGHQDDVVDIDALAQERCVSVGARDRTARLWKVVEETQLVFRGGGGDSSGKKKKRGETAAPDTEGLDPESLAHEGCMDRVAMIDDELFVTGSDNGAIALWSIQKKKPVFVLPRAHGVDPRLLPTEVSAEENPDPKVVPAPQPRWITALKTIPYSDVILSGSWDGCVRVWRLSHDKKKIEPVCVLGVPSSSETDGEQKINGDDEKAEAGSGGLVINGVINGIAMFERGDRGRDGLCVVAAIGKEHRLGRWKVIKGGRNGAMVFEVPRVPKATSNGVEGSDDEDDEE
ncbi:WD domain, G-beta repeat-containing protein [Coniochaeta ligniaria NRRL 30616]|uniref:WD domain, G-beta repeat-containing protein n=1 Tax=Coniochaeta ligniaria NRRL 30616 TaxID=1408157 RepID=A0A1J7IRW7_9PEZI|nr:WD domain, G-beta repeat-containing protein [Coniochaeta ligniaria NRRL 30616]